MCETCEKFRRRIVQAELQKDGQAERVFRSLLDGHIQICPDYRLVRLLWPGRHVMIVDGERRPL